MPVGADFGQTTDMIIKNPDMEMGKTVDKVKQQVEKPKSNQNILESKSEVPDKKSKTVVKFNLDQDSNKDNTELTNKIFTHIDGYDEWVNEQNDAAIKAKTPLKGIMKKNSLTNKESDVGQNNNFTSKSVVDKNKINELLKADTNIVKNQENKKNDKKDKKDQGIEEEKSTNGIPEIQEGLNKNLTSQKINYKDNPVNESKKADNFPTEYKTNKTAKKTNVENVNENIACQNVNNEKQTATMTRTKVDFANEKSDVKNIAANGTKHSGNFVTDNTSNKKAKNPSTNSTILSNEVNSPCQELDSKNASSNIVNDDGKVEKSASLKFMTKSVEANKEPIEKSKLMNNDTPAHKTFTKNMAVVVSPRSQKKEVSRGEQNSCKNNVATKPLNSKNYNEHESESSLSNSKENSCAGKIYKEREIGHEIMEEKINESVASSHQASKKLEKSIEVKHAKQCFVVNQPLSPSLNRKEIIQNTTQAQTDEERLGSQSKTVQSKTVNEKSQTTSVTNMPNMVNTESKNVVVVTPNPNDTKTRGENTRLLESSKNSDISPKSNNTYSRAHLDTQLEKMDKDHEVKMQKISTIMDTSKEKTTNVPDNRFDRSLSSISESKKVLNQNSSDMKAKPVVVKTSIEKSQNSLSLIPQALQQNFSSSHVETATKSDLNKDLAKLDKQHAVKMKKIEDSVDLSTNTKKMGLSNAEVNANRPSTLGPSRFDNPSKHMTENFRENIPKRNDSIHTLKQDNAPKTNIQPGNLDKPSPPKYQISKSSTTILDNRPLSPGLSRKKMDRNFNASPEPFFSSKSSSNVLDLTSSSTKTPTITPLKELKENNSDKSQTLTSKSSLSGSKSYSTIPSVASLPRPATSYSSQTTASPSFPTVASLPKPASFSATSTSPPSSTLSKTTTLSSPLNFAKSSNFDNRAKSEGSTLSTNMPASVQNNYSLSNSSNKTTSDLYMKIQTTKDKHKSDIQTAMNFDKTSWKPPVIKHKYDRPDPTPSKYTMTLGREKMSRIQERERVVIDKLMMDRTSRGKSDDFLKNSSYRL